MSEIIFHPDVEYEVKSSYLWYQKQAEGLGDDFLTELEAGYEAIAGLPNTWPKFQQRFHRFLLSKFPFSIIYKINGKAIFIIAVMHNSRKPGYWIERT